jgi:hypothetical protein
VSVCGEHPTVFGPGDEAAVSEGAQRGEQVGLANVQGIAELLGWLGTRRRAEAFDDAGLERIVGGDWRVEGAISGALDDEVRGVAGDEAQAEGRRCGGTAVLDDEDAIVAVAGEVEAGIEPGGEVAGAAKLLGGVCGGRLAHVVHEQDRDVVLALQGAKRAEHGRDIARAVFVESGDQADEWIEDEEAGFVAGDGAVEAAEMDLVVEPELGDIEQEQRRLGEVEATSAGDAIEAQAQVGRWVLGAEEQHGTWVWRREPAERWGAGGDRKRELGGDPGLERLGRATEQPDRRAGEQLVDEPALLAGARLDLVDAADRERRAGVRGWRHRAPHAARRRRGSWWCGRAHGR